MGSARALLAPLGAALLALPGTARAWPVDRVVELAPGEERFFKVGPLGWVEVDDRRILTAELFESGELLLTGGAPGAALLLAYGGGRLEVWRVRVKAQDAVTPPVPPAARDGVARACPGAKLEPGVLAARVAGPACLAALRALLERDAYLARELELEFEVPVLQEQLKELGRALAAAGLGERVALRYRGAGLVLQGALSPAEHRRALAVVFQHSVGRVPLDDQIVIQGAPDGGAHVEEQP